MITLIIVSKIENKLYPFPHEMLIIINMNIYAYNKQLNCTNVDHFCLPI